MQELHFLDLRRWLLGDLPPWFLLEIIFRAIFLYILLQLILRLMGYRLAAQMTVSELAIILTVGGVVVTPMLSPNVGIAASIIVLCIAFLFQRGISRLALKHQQAEAIAIGNVTTLLQDGRILSEAIEKMGLSHERMDSLLRIQGIQQLGELQRVYAEPSGSFSLYRAAQEIPGLPVIPDFDIETHFKGSFCHNHWACHNCGYVKKESHQPCIQCDYCGGKKWRQAVLSVRPK
jgi:uncharacterized membrane protein YcaP (DUF421 family)